MGNEDGKGLLLQFEWRYTMKNDQRCKVCGKFIRPGEPYSVIILPGTKAPEYIHKACEGKKGRV